MPRNGAGAYSRAVSAYVYNTTIDQVQVNAEMVDIAAALTASLAKDGQTVPTANLPMGGFKHTGLAAGSAAGDSVRWEQASAGVLTAAGDTPYASAANTVARMPATADVAAHATTSNIWGAREIVLTGAVVTFTDIADAPYAGAVAWVKMNDAHIWTDGAVFDVQGGANYTAAANDWIRVYATTVSTFEVTVFSALGNVGVATQAEQEAGTSTVKAVSPGRQQFHPSACKFFVAWDNAGGIQGNAYNVASITDVGAGQFVVNIATDFFDVYWVPFFDATQNDGGMGLPYISGIAVGTLNCRVRNLADSGYADALGPYYAGGFGDQA